MCSGGFVYLAWIITQHLHSVALENSSVSSSAANSNSAQNSRSRLLQQWELLKVKKKPVHVWIGKHIIECEYQCFVFSSQPVHGILQLVSDWLQ